MMQLSTTSPARTKSMEQADDRRPRIQCILDHRCGRFGVIYLVVWEGRRDEVWEPEWRLDYRSVREYFLVREPEW